MKKDGAAKDCNPFNGRWAWMAQKVATILAGALGTILVYCICIALRPPTLTKLLASPVL